MVDLLGVFSGIQKVVLQKLYHSTGVSRVLLVLYVYNKPVSNCRFEKGPYALDVKWKCIPDKTRFFWPNEHFPSAAYTAFPKDLDARLSKLYLCTILVYHGVDCLTDFVPVNVERDDSSMRTNFEIQDNEQQSTATRTPHKESARDETNRRFVVDFILAVISSIPISVGTTLFRDGCRCHVWGIFGWFLWVVLT